MTGIPIRGKAKGSAGAAYTIAVRRGAQRLDFTRDYLIALYQDAATANVNADLMVAQWDLETNSGRSTYWTRDGNPGGLAAFDDGSNWGLTFTPQTAARAQITHMLRYLGAPNVPIDWIKLDARWDAVAEAGYVGSVTTTADLGKGRWATDPNYASKLAERYEAYWGPYVPATGDKPMSTGMQKVRFVGLNKDVWLPDDITVKIDIVPASLTNIRSNQPFSGQTKTTWHDTGNPGSTPQSERNFLHGGAAGGYVGYNFAYGDKTIIQLTPLNEVTWAAGTPDGNRYSWHAEQCFGGSQDWDTTIATGAALHGGLCAAMGWDVDSALVPHQYWYGKWCPGQILNKGIWNSVVAKVKAAAARATAAAAGGEVKPAPTPGSLWPYPQPVPPTFWEQLQTVPYVMDGDTVWTRNTTMYRVKQSTKRQQFAVKDERVVGPDLKVGETFRAAATGQSRTDHKMWVITPGLTRIDMDALDVVAEDHAAA